MRWLAALILSAGAAYAACPGTTQLEMNDCAAAEYQRFDAELNAVWPIAKSRADAIGAGVQLLDAQRKWLAFRDAACTAEIAPYGGGSIQPLIWYNCLTRMTRNRTFDLRQMVEP
jgi:uncharacterized protein YecT (DUF1311 family)